MVSEGVKHFLVERLMTMMSSVKPLTSLVQKSHFHSVTHDQQNLHGVSVVVMMMKSHHCLVILVVTC
jgi:hypothetical protein